MPVQFPSNPTIGDTYAYPGLPAASVYWQWNGFGWAFKGATGGAEPPSSFVPGQTQIVLFQSYENQGIPAGANTGALWFNTDSGILYTYVGGASTGFEDAWVQATILNNDITLPS